MTDSLLDVTAVLDELVELVETARGRPMTSSCVVNRADVLGLLDDLRAKLPEAIDEAQGVLQTRTAVVEDGEREAESLLERARADRQRLLDDTDVLREARLRAEQVLAEADAAAARMRGETDDYVDAKLAQLESMLSSTLQVVERGRARIAGDAG